MNTYIYTYIYMCIYIYMYLEREHVAGFSVCTMTRERRRREVLIRWTFFAIACVLQHVLNGIQSGCVHLILRFVSNVCTVVGNFWRNHVELWMPHAEQSDRLTKAESHIESYSCSRFVFICLYLFEVRVRALSHYGWPRLVKLVGVSDLLRRRGRKLLKCVW